LLVSLAHQAERKHLAESFAGNALKNDEIYASEGGVGNASVPDLEMSWSVREVVEGEGGLGLEDAGERERSIGWPDLDEGDMSAVMQVCAYGCLLLALVHV
jgi:hypothetical protein